MLFGLETYLALLGGGMGLLAAAGQLLIKEKRNENYNLAALSFTLGLLLFQNVSVFTGYCIKKPVDPDLPSDSHMDSGPSALPCIS